MTLPASSFSFDDATAATSLGGGAGSVMATSAPVTAYPARTASTAMASSTSSWSAAGSMVSTVEPLAAPAAIAMLFVPLTE
ncbi:MAG: hypothetical protein OXU70_07060 [Gammaproteobacteria bacterium]|nr:hypothetical protein [Gammaproteobacteria bacterium]